LTQIIIASIQSTEAQCYGLVTYGGELKWASAGRWPSAEGHRQVFIKICVKSNRCLWRLQTCEFRLYVLLYRTRI